MLMKDIDHDYWADYDATNKDPDMTDPDLRVAMTELYGNSKIDFGSIKNGTVTYTNPDERTHCSPDSYSSYTSLTRNYKKSMSFREETYLKNKELADKVRRLAGTIAGELFFPCHQIDGNTINCSRGTLGAISDRVDLTLRDIKYFYDKKQDHYPLKEALLRYDWFFSQFSGFKEYIDHCLLQDFCDENYNVKLWKNSDGLPKNAEELVDFWNWSVSVLTARSRRIKAFAEQRNLFEK